MDSKPFRIVVRKSESPAETEAGLVVKFQDPSVARGTRSRFQHESCIFSAPMALLVLHKLFSLLRDRWSRTRRPDPRNVVHPEPEPSHGDPRQRLPRRNGIRSALGVWCDYTIREFLSEELYVVHEGQAVAVNIGPGGLLLFMEHDPAPRQAFNVQLPATPPGPRMSTSVEVRWTRPLPLEEEEEQRYLVGVRFLSPIVGSRAPEAFVAGHSDQI